MKKLTALLTATLTVSASASSLSHADENIAYGQRTPAVVVNTWMNSTTVPTSSTPPIHRSVFAIAQRELLDPDVHWLNHSAEKF